MNEFATIEQLYDLFSLSSGVNTDTRTIAPNQIFIALKGERFNGNKFADAALNAGALYAFVDEEQYVTSEQHILVENGLLALQTLAKYHRSTLTIPIIGLTGSNGKTTTKELIAACLSMQYQCYATKGNLNNHIGVPLSLLEINNSHEIAVIEMGANRLKDIEELCSIATPDYGLITNIGLAHIEGFGSKENIKKGKGELYDHIRSTEEKTVFINADDSVLMEMAHDLEKVTYGIHEDISGELISSTTLLKMKIIDDEQEFTIQTNLVGDYNFYNALAACAIGKFFNIPLLDIAEAIEEYTPVNNRSQIIDKNGITIISDAYNANPSSMKAALKNFSQQKGEHKLAILGHMLELGDESELEHEKIVYQCKELELEAIFIGSLFENASKAESYSWFQSVAEAKSYFVNEIKKGSVILLKGSRGIAVEQILEP